MAPFAPLSMSRRGRQSSSRRSLAPAFTCPGRGAGHISSDHGKGAVMTCQTAVDMDNETPQQVRDTLPAELATVEGKHPGCHCWLSSELRSYATRTYKGRCAVTLDAASPSLLGVVIDAWVSEGGPRRLAGLDG